MDAGAGGWSGRAPFREHHAMFDFVPISDLVLVLGGTGLFVSMLGYARLCDRL